MRLIILCLFASFAIASPAAAAPNDEAWELIRDKKPAKAIEKLDRIIAGQEREHAGETRRIYCAHTPEETLTYMTMAATDGKSAVALDPTWCMAIFLKGFALIDLNRPDDARPYLERAVEMAPMNSQFLSELAEWHKVRHEWTEAYALFERAEPASDLSLAANRQFHKARAIRGMGFVLIEQGRLDDAEKLFRKCLEMDPNDEKAKIELEYIRQQRERRI